MTFFFYFFWNFLARGEYERQLGGKFFFLHFFGLSHPVLAKNNAGKRFFNFLNFFAIFWEFSCSGLVWTEFGTNFFFFLSFLAYLIPFWLKIMPEWGFWIFLLFFSQFSFPGGVWTEFRTKFFFFFIFSQPISSRLG